MRRWLQPFRSTWAVAPIRPEVIQHEERRAERNGPGPQRFAAQDADDETEVHGVEHPVMHGKEARRFALRRRRRLDRVGAERRRADYRGATGYAGIDDHLRVECEFDAAAGDSSRNRRRL